MRKRLSDDSSKKLKLQIGLINRKLQLERIYDLFKNSYLFILQMKYKNRNIEIG